MKDKMARSPPSSAVFTVYRFWVSTSKQSGNEKTMNGMRLYWIMLSKIRQDRPLDINGLGPDQSEKQNTTNPDPHYPE